MWNGESSPGAVVPYFAGLDPEHLNDLNIENMVTEEFKIIVDTIFRRLENSVSLEYIFPETLTSEERKYIHTKCWVRGFGSKSQGKEPHRKLRIWRSNQNYQKVFHLEHQKEIEEAITACMDTYPSHEPRLDYRPHNNNGEQTFGKLNNNPPAYIRPKAPPNEFREFRMKLPVWQKRDEVLYLLNNYQVLIISSETGSGKTTQIPQYILENASMKGEKCKVVCTQPRRLSTITVAERVAAERGEKLGETVGYQIKLETKIGLHSALIYCTNGILLRTLMNSPQSFLKNITHIIVDEIHERDKYTDFLLISLRQCLTEFPNLKLILMSATADVNLFSSYFYHRPAFLNIPGSLYSVQELFLEEILLSLKDGSVEANSQTLYNIDEWKGADSTEDNVPSNGYNETFYEIAEDMNRAILRCVKEASEDSFHQLMMLILSENGNVNHQTGGVGYTPLMAAAIHGNNVIVQQLLNLGADAQIRSEMLNAAEWAEYSSHYTTRDLINSYVAQVESDNNYENIIDNYDQYISTESIDFQLIVKILKSISRCDDKGTILVFLPGFDDITTCMQTIQADEELNLAYFEILMLHSCLNVKVQHRVFEHIEGKQKIILSTNIAETSITIPDVMYVIDSGRAKEKTYDTISGTCSLQTVWISKASVKQRAGRAGRTCEGICFHIFSKKRFISLLPNAIPEMLRVPLHELCLHTKLLAPAHSKIAAYLQLALEPPPTLSVDNAIQGLKNLGALEENEELTPLGEHLVQLSVEPRLGKMLIYAVILKCLDPVLTIVACLACKDPFTLPQSPKEKHLASAKQRQLTGDTLSDHFAFIKAFQLWQQHFEGKFDNSKRLKELYINSASMQTINDTRAQLLSQLRAAGFITINKPFSVQEANLRSSQWPIVKAVLAVGCYPNLTFNINSNFATRMEKKVTFHKSSCLSLFPMVLDDNKQQVDDFCIIFEELSKTGRHCSVKVGTVVTPLTIAILCGSDKKFDKCSLFIDEFLNFQHNYTKLSMFSLAVQRIINKRVIQPHCHLTWSEQNAVECLSQVLALEEARYSLLVQPPDVGLVPKQLNSMIIHHNIYRPKNTNTQRDTTYSPRDANVPRDFAATPGSGRNSRNSSFKNELVRSKRSPPKGRRNLGQQFNSQGEPTDFNSLLMGLNITPPVGEARLPVDRPVHVPSETVPYNSPLFRNPHLMNDPRADMLLQAIQQCAGYPLGVNSNDIIPPTNYVLPPNSACFIVRPPDGRSLAAGITAGSWIFSPQTEKKILRTFQQLWPVILFFSIAKSQEFQGMAQVRVFSVSQAANPVVFPVHWLSTAHVPFRLIRLRNIVNNYTDQLVFQGGDGQELSLGAAQKLCDMFLDSSLNVNNTSSRAILGSTSR